MCEWPDCIAGTKAWDDTPRPLTGLSGTQQSSPSLATKKRPQVALPTLVTAGTILASKTPAAPMPAP